MLEIDNLTCGYDDKFHLRNINFKLADKEFVGIIGPNGSGKTTLLKAISRLLKPNKGRVLFAGKDIWQINLKELAMKIAVVSQSPVTNSMTVEDFVLLGRIPHFKRLQFLESKEDLEMAEKIMALTDVLRFKERAIDEMSGGEKQLVFLTRALMQEPKLILLDEPTAHLDITHQVVILDLLKRLNKKTGLTVVMVLHDLNLASEYCERLILINEGQIYKTGKPEEVLQYQIIEQVYKTVVVVDKNPISSKPYLLVVPEEERQRSGQR